MKEPSSLSPIAVILMIALLLPHIIGPDLPLHVVIRAGQLHRFMSWQHEAVSAYDEKIEACTQSVLFHLTDVIQYNGRWLTDNGQYCKAASFGGSLLCW